MYFASHNDDKDHFFTWKDSSTHKGQQHHREKWLWWKYFDKIAGADATKQKGSSEFFCKHLAQDGASVPMSCLAQSLLQRSCNRSQPKWPEVLVCQDNHVFLTGVCCRIRHSRCGGLLANLWWASGPLSHDPRSNFVGYPLKHDTPKTAE